MIRYTLTCEGAHRFESWFRDSGTFDAQASGGLVSCPICGSDRVAKSIMSPALNRGAPGDRSDIGGGSDAGSEVEVPAESGSVEGPSLSRERRALRARIEAMRTTMMAGEDVGDRFPDEARRIHDGTVPARAIHGRATLGEAKALCEDGIPILPVPPMPDGAN